MTTGQLADLITAVTELLGALAWPAVALYVIARFGESFRDFASNLSELTLKGAGLEATVKRRQVEAAAALGAATAKAVLQGSAPTVSAQEARFIARAVQSVSPSRARRLRSASVLWVDDHPDNNIYERRALEAFDIAFDISTSTAEALQKVGQRRYDLIISDLGRAGDKRAGVTLLQELRRQGNHTPYIIYSGPGAAFVRDEALRLGAAASTNRARELFESVLAALSLGTA
jgi:CheY-like chemotaxis protein